jgi:hypothetical protein
MKTRTAITLQTAKRHIKKSIQYYQQLPGRISPVRTYDKYYYSLFSQSERDELEKWFDAQKI